MHEAYKKKKTAIQEGLDCFYDKKYAAAISTLTPLVEGVFNEYLIEKTGKGLSYKGDKIIQSIIKEALNKVDDQSLSLPSKFGEYLNEYFFQNTRSSTSDKAVRNTTSHGRANDDAFTRESALKVILTIDQIFFYMLR